MTMGKDFYCRQMAVGSKRNDVVSEKLTSSIAAKNILLAVAVIFGRRVEDFAGRVEDFGGSVGQFARGDVDFRSS